MGVRTSGAVLLPHAPPSVAVARGRLVADLTAADVRAAAIGDAAVVVSELLSNAIRHAAPLHDRQVEVSWTLGDGLLRLAVSDGGGRSVPRLARPSPTEPGGRGLGIVQSLSSRWGVQTGEGTTTVWAILPAPQVAHGNGPAVRGSPRRPSAAAAGTLPGKAGNRASRR